jgi:hypothetical protein
VIFLTLPMTIAFAYGLQKTLQFAERKRVLTGVLIADCGVWCVRAVWLSGTQRRWFFSKSRRSFPEGERRQGVERLHRLLRRAWSTPHHKTEEYQYDAMLISTFSHVKTLNASSSQFPRDWNFYFIKNPDYEAAVKQWIDSQKISGNVCRVEIDPEVEAFDPKAPSPIDDPEFSCASCTETLPAKNRTTRRSIRKSKRSGIAELMMRRVSAHTSR